MDFEGTLVDWYNGAHMLDVVAAWAYVEANRQLVLEKLILFEKAYGQLLALHAAGKLGVGDVDFSAQNLELARRVNQLIGPGLDNSEVREAAQEIHDLADRCVRALKVVASSSVE
jgi:hypothetical protein